MNILLSNDDGYRAPGLAALARAVEPYATSVTVIAPKRDRSGASSSLTLRTPLTVEKGDNGFYYIDGTPADCAHIGVTGLMDTPPDIVMAGVNAGTNVADDVLYSGTVAAAMEGRSLKLTPIAVSLAGHVHFDTAARVAADLLQKVASFELPTGTVLSLNVPDIPYASIKGIRVTRLGTRFMAQPAVRLKNDANDMVWQIGGIGPVNDNGPGTDFAALDDGWVSLTPLHIDLTYSEVMPQLFDWLGRAS